MQGCWSADGPPRGAFIYTSHAWRPRGHPTHPPHRHRHESSVREPCGTAWPREHTTGGAVGVEHARRWSRRASGWREAGGRGDWGGGAELVSLPYTCIMTKTMRGPERWPSRMSGTNGCAARLPACSDCRLRGRASRRRIEVWSAGGVGERAGPREPAPRVLSGETVWGAGGGDVERRRTLGESDSLPALRTQGFVLALSATYTYDLLSSALSLQTTRPHRTCTAAPKAHGQRPPRHTRRRWSRWPVTVRCFGGAHRDAGNRSTVSRAASHLSPFCCPTPVAATAPEPAQQAPAVHRT